MTSALTAQVPLPGGVSIPQLGLGVFQVPPAEAQRVVEDALTAGYRHVDTAAAYVNEAGVGAGLAASGLAREEVFLTSKLRNGDQGREQTLRAYDDSCARLGVAALDLYLIHWPNPGAGRWQDSWRACEQLLEQGRVRAIGVSNFLPEHLTELDTFATHRPAVNQIELHPAFQQRELVAACRERGIVVQAYSPLGQGTVLADPRLQQIAHRHDATPAQVVLRWHLQHGRVVIPKTVTPRRMRENAALDLQLDADELARIDALESGGRLGNDPRTFALSQIR